MQTSNTTHENSLAELRLWQLISPSLPVGAYAYSQGLEFAVEHKWVGDADACENWIRGQLQNNLCYLDVPIMQRIYQARSESNYEKITYWNQYLLSSRETQELLDEDRQIGIALTRLLIDLKVPEIDRLVQYQNENNEAHLSFATAFSLAAFHWHIPPKNAARGYLWAWCENQVAAAVKLIPLGQTAGQKILANLADVIPATIELSFEVSDEEIGSTSYGVAIASAFHETQYTRLFRS